MILNRSTNTIEIVEECKWLFVKDFIYNDNDLQKITNEKIKILDNFNESLPIIKEWEYSKAKFFLNNWLERNNHHIKDIGPTLRISLTGQIKAPDLIEILTTLGPKEIKSRINRLIKYMDL